MDRFAQNKIALQVQDMGMIKKCSLCKSSRVCMIWQCVLLLSFPFPPPPDPMNAADAVFWPLLSPLQNYEFMNFSRSDKTTVVGWASIKQLFIYEFEENSNIWISCRNGEPADISHAATAAWQTQICLKGPSLNAYSIREAPKMSGTDKCNIHT